MFFLILIQSSDQLHNEILQFIKFILNIQLQIILIYHSKDYKVIFYFIYKKFILIFCYYKIQHVQSNTKI